MSELWAWIPPLAVLSLGLWRPALGLLVFVGALGLYGSPPGGPYLAALDGAGLLVVLLGLRGGGRPHRLPLDGWVWALLVVSLASLLPLAWRPPGLDARSGLGLVAWLPQVETWTPMYGWRAALNLLLGVLIYRALRRRPDARPLQLSLALAAGTAVVLMAGLAEQLGWLDLRVWRPVGAQVYEGRLHSLFFHSGWFAEFVVMGAPVAVAGLLVKGRGWRVAGLALAVLAAWEVVLSAQRGAWIALLAQLLAWWLLARPSIRLPRLRTRHAVVAALLAVVLVVPFLLRPQTADPLLQRVRNLNLSGRGLLWQQSLALWAERPVTGWGLGSFNPVYDLHHRRGTRDAVTTSATAHNLYLMLAVERGGLGLAVFLGLLWVAVRSLRRALLSGDVRRVTLARGVTVALVGCLVYGLVQYMLFLRVIEWLFWVLLGLVAALSGDSDEPRSETLTRRGLAAAAVVLALLRAVYLDPIEVPGDRAFGIHEQERRHSARWTWTSGLGALGFERSGELLVLQLLNGHPRAGQRPLHVRLWLDGELVAERTLADSEWQWLELVPPSDPDSDSTLVIEARPAFRPWREFRAWPELGTARDIRELGVVMRWLHWLPAPEVEADPAG